MSLALLLSSSEIISRISSGEQSSRNIEFLLEGARKSSKVLNLQSEILLSTRVSLSLEAMEIKYLLNSLQIVRRFVIFTLSIIKDGFIFGLHLPRSWFMTCHVFFSIVFVLNNFVAVERTLGHIDYMS